MYYSAVFPFGGERSEPITNMLIMLYDTESQSRNADFISIAPKGETTHYILRVASAPSSSAVTDSLDFQVAEAPLQIQFASAKCVRCASLRSGDGSGFAAEGGGLPLARQ